MLKRRPLRSSLVAAACVLIAACSNHQARPRFPTAAFHDGVIIGQDGKSQHVRYQIVGNMKLLQGDMILTRPAPRTGFSTRGFALADLRTRWPHAIINYCLDANLDNTQRSELRDAIAAWQSHTNISFRDAGSPCTDSPGDSGMTVVHVVSWNYQFCAATEGYTGDSDEQLGVSSDPNYCDTGTITHELGHLLGLQHEQSRPDRNSYVEIQYDNILDDFKDQFDIIDDGSATLGTPYDCSSIMHYVSTAFSKNGDPTITSKDPHTCVISDEETPTAEDFATVRTMYK